MPYSPRNNNLVSLRTSHTIRSKSKLSPRLSLAQITRTTIHTWVEYAVIMRARMNSLRKTLVEPLVRLDRDPCHSELIGCLERVGLASIA